MAVVLAALLTAVVVDLARAPPTGPTGLARGIYFGWLAGDDSRFDLVGAPCTAGSRPQVSELVGGALLTHGDVASYRGLLDDGRELQLTTVTTAGLQRLFRRSTPAPESITFSGLHVRCRSWREYESDFGRASVVRMPDTKRRNGAEVPISRAGPLHDSTTAPVAPELTAHVLPVPGGTDVLAMLLLWNRTAGPLTVSSLRYGPEPVTTGRLRAVAGPFERYDELEAAILAGTPGGEPGSPLEVSLERHAGELELELETGGFALLALTRGSFAVPRAWRGSLVYLAYPVIEFRPSSRSTGTATDTANDTANDTVRHLALNTPLFARWSPHGGR